MWIGQVPRVVLLPTLQDQVIAPVELAVLSPSPAAVEDPDLYSTSIEHFAFGDVLIVTLAVLFLGTVAVREVTLTESLLDVGVAVGFALGFVVGLVVAVGFVVGKGPVGDGAATEEAGVDGCGDELTWPIRP
jgi:hypothetical protein